MIQRGGFVSYYVKIGYFYALYINENQADLLLGLERDEAFRNIQFLNKQKSVITVNSNKTFPNIKCDTIYVYVFKELIQ